MSNTALSATIGQGKADVSFKRSASGFTSDGKTNRDQSFGSLALDGLYKINPNLVIAPTAGVVFSRSETKAYFDKAGRPVAAANSNSTLGQVGATLYFPTDKFTPFVGGSLNHQLNRTKGDRSYEVVGAGVIVPFGPVNVAFGATALVGKSGEKETGFNIGFTRRF
jgi:outer membrane autotransporter protein